MQTIWNNGNKRQRIGTKSWQVSVLPGEHAAKTTSISNTRLNPALKAFNVVEATGRLLLWCALHAHTQHTYAQVNHYEIFKYCSKNT